jgi:N6-L-threonylcarbamoyladenine synthase
LARLAEEGESERFEFPRPMTNRPGLDFSFSGLKTHTLTTLAQTGGTRQDKADVAAAFQSAVVDSLVIKCRRALQQCRLTRLVVAGGVSANRHMRQTLAALARKEKYEVYFPRLEFCTDNGAMIAFAGCQRLLQGNAIANLEIQARPRWPLDELTPP